MTIKKLKSIDIINVLSDLVSEKLETTVKLPRKEFVNNRPQTTYHLTDEGRTQFEEYVALLNKLVEKGKNAQKV